MASGLRRRAVIVPAIGVLVVGGGAVAWAQSGGSSGGYRTAVVVKGDVQQLLTQTGTVAVVDRAKAHFRASGIVGSVKVTVGQTVAKGQVLATMDTGSLADAVTKAKATLATAEATLETGGTSSSSATSTPTVAPTASSPSRGGDTGAGLGQAQQAAARALQQATQALVTATTACASPATPTGTPSATATPSSTATAAATATAGPRTPPVLSCATALRQALSAQRRAAQAQQALAQALAKVSTSSTSAASSPASSSTSPSSASSSSAQRNSAGGGGSLTSTAARITTDTAAVAAAQVALDQADKDLAAVSLTAPVAGTVASLPWTVGSTTSPSDSAVLFGTGAVEVTVDVPAASIRAVRVGLPATVRGDGATRSVSGLVTRIGLLPTSSTSTTSSTTTYPVVVRVAAGPGLVDGGAAAVSIAITSVRDVVTVPNSALHSGRVTVLAKGKATSVPVTTGVTGALTTEVTKGLSAGQTVVLADLSEALPTSSTTSNRSSFGGNGGFGGAGFGPPGSGQVAVRRG
ncbi:MAG: hypothetical protein JWO22_140 [Frankiales bacterium]|nr:hypothetical protein [Frankiales bacterium]